MRISRFILAGLILSIFSCSDQEGVDPAVKDYPVTQAWWNDQVFYQLFVRSFYDSDGDGNGDLKGVIQKLDYLNDGNPSTENDLGVTALMLMPVFQASSYDGYEVTDYLNIDPDYGSLKDLEDLISEAAQRGIRVVLDFPVNHTSGQHPWFVKSSSSDPGIYKDWYIWRKDNPGDYSPYGGPLWHLSSEQYYYGIYGRNKPDLNFKNEAVTAEIKKISEFWIKEKGADGFRLEGAAALIETGDNIMFTQANLDWFRNYFAFVRNQDPSFMLIGDVPGLSSIAAPYADDRVDLCYEYELSGAIFNAIRNQAAGVIREKLIDVVNRYPSLQWGVFLTNQFQNRTAAILNDENELRIAAAILLTMPGVPFIFYGEEIGMTGSGAGEEIRRPLQWSSGAQAGFTSGTPWYPVDENFIRKNIAFQSQEEGSLLNYYRKLIRIRLQSQALKRGMFEPLKVSDPRVLAYFRTVNSEVVLIVHNVSSASISNIVLSSQDGSLAAATYNGKYLFTGEDAPSLTIQGGGSYVSYTPVLELAPYSSVLIRFVRREQ